MGGVGLPPPPSGAELFKGVLLAPSSSSFRKDTPAQWSVKPHLWGSISGPLERHCTIWPLGHVTKGAGGRTFCCSVLAVR